MWELIPKYVTEGESATAKIYRKNSHFIHKGIIPKFGLTFTKAFGSAKSLMKRGLSDYCIMLWLVAPSLSLNLAVIDIRIRPSDPQIPLSIAIC